MNKATNEYKLNGWWIRASEIYNDWDLTPSFEHIEDGDELEVKHQAFRDNEDIRFDRLKEAKDWTKTEEAKQLKEKYC